MRALVYQGPWKIAVEDRPDPEPAAGEVLIRVLATGICGSDLHGFTGENGRRHPDQVMGHEFVGTVVAAGPGVTGIEAGRLATANPVIACQDCPACRAGSQENCANRRVIGVDPTISAAFAELILVPSGNVVLLPDDLPPEYGALVEPLAVGFHAARRGGVAAEDRVLIVGGGPIGQACYLAARRQGATRIVITELDPNRIRLLTDIGATVINPADTSDLATAVADRLGGPADVVIDAVGMDATLAQALDSSAPGGRIVLVGMQSPKLTVDAYAISTKQRSIIGAFTYSDAEFRETAEWIATRPAELARLIEGRVTLADAPQAFADLAGRKNPASKVLVLPAGRV